MEIGALLEMIEKYGLTVVLLLYFIYMYTKNNADTLNLIIAIKDENNKLHNAHVDAVYVTKDEMKEEMKSVESSIRTDIGKIDEKINRIEILVISKRGDEK